MKLTFGEIREHMEVEHRTMVEHIVIKKLDLKQPYYILVHSNIVGTHDIKTTFVTMLEKPPALIGTVCYLVENDKGRVTRKWALPLDIVRPPQVEGEDIDEGIAIDAKEFEDYVL